MKSIQNEKNKTYLQKNYNFMQRTLMLWNELKQAEQDPQMCPAPEPPVPDQSNP